MDPTCGDWCVIFFKDAPICRLCGFKGRIFANFRVCHLFGPVRLLEMGRGLLPEFPELAATDFFVGGK